METQAPLGRGLRQLGQERPGWESCVLGGTTKRRKQTNVDKAPTRCQAFLSQGPCAELMGWC